MYVYGVVGVLWFGGLMDETAVNFNTSLNAVGALLQILTGESWQLIMFRAVDAINNISAVFYFISLVALVLLLFANVFIGTSPRTCGGCSSGNQCLPSTWPRPVQVSWWIRSKSWTRSRRRVCSR